MTSRLSLYAHSARNQVGRAFGLAVAYSPAQRWTAGALWSVYATRYDDLTCAALLGCADGETAFLLMARGDHNEAGGAGQWHVSRQQAILKNTGINVWTAGAADQARALMAEISEQWPGGNSYRHVEAHLMFAPTLSAKMQVLVAEFEQSASQTRDLARRVPMANYWLQQFGKKVP